MARQRGDRQIKGSVGQTTYKRTKHGYLAQEKVESIKPKIKTDKRFERMRENMSEFGRAGFAGRALRETLRTVIALSPDGTASTRLHALMMSILKTDPISDRGLRMVMKGLVAKLEKFEFNESAQLSFVFPPKPAYIIDRAGGQVSIQIPAFVPANALKVPPGADHFKICAAALTIDFDTAESSAGKASTAHLLWDNNEVAAITLDIPLPPASTLPVVLAIGFEFNQLVNGKYYPIRSVETNGLQLVRVDTV